MFRTVETYRFTLIDHSPPDGGDHRPIPCTIAITSRRDHPDQDACYPKISPTTDARLSMLSRSIITTRVAEDLDGKPLDAPFVLGVPASHNPEAIALWAFHLARDTTQHDRAVTDFELVIESALVAIGDGTFEYAPTAGDR